MSAHWEQEERGSGLNVQLYPDPSRKILTDFRSRGRLSDLVHDVLKLIEVVEEGEDFRVETMSVDVNNGGHFKLESGVMWSLQNEEKMSIEF